MASETKQRLEDVTSLQPGEDDHIMAWAARILRTSNADEKVRLTNRAVALWRNDLLRHDLSSEERACLTTAGFAHMRQEGADSDETAEMEQLSSEEQQTTPEAQPNSSSFASTLDEMLARFLPPEEPPRESLTVVSPQEMRLRKGGTLQNRVAILHSLANIEMWAIDLSWDIIARFGIYNGSVLPRDFFSDFVTVAEDEARHFSMLRKRLEELGSKFGDLPVHQGLWQSAQETSQDLLARLAIVHMVHEARGLDVTPNTIKRLRRHGDDDSADMLQVIYEEEITHVTAGMKWFRHLTPDVGADEDQISAFHRVVRKHFHGTLKPPFNTEARQQAGFTEDWYLPLTSK